MSLRGPRIPRSDRYLGNELQIPLVGVGTREAYLAIRSDDQLENRFAPMVLHPWEVGEDTRSLLASFGPPSRCGGPPTWTART